jgi:hypothetical protein
MADEGFNIPFNVFGNVAQTLTEVREASLRAARSLRLLTAANKSLALAQQEAAAAAQIQSEAVKKMTARQRLRFLAARAATLEMKKQNLLARRGFKTQQNYNKSVRQGTRRVKNYNKSLKQVGSTANRISFTFRRLFGILAAFAIAREAISGFKSLVAQSIAFNKQIEQAQLGIASLIVAVGNVRGPMGETVTLSEKLALAQREARRQTALLRKDALTTTATFQQLLDTFQIGLAPGLQAGLVVDEIRKFTLRISQAAAAIGLPQQQLAEEIRSILAGTIQARTTRIAVALGITNEDIRRMKEMGTLAEFLDERFRAFGEAGKFAMDQMAGLIGRVQDALRQLLGEAGGPLFSELKTILRDLFKAFTQETAGGLIEPSPRAVELFRFIFDGLATAAQLARQIGQNLATSGNLERIIALFGTTLKGALIIVLGIVEGLFTAFGGIADIIITIGQSLGVVTNTTQNWALVMKDIVSSATTALITFKAIQVVVKLLTGEIAKIKLLLAGSLIIAAIAVHEIFKELTGIKNLDVFGSLQLGILAFKQGFERTVAELKLLWIRFVDFIGDLFTDPNTILRAFRDTVHAIAIVMYELGIITDETLTKIEGGFRDLGRKVKSAKLVEAEKERDALVKSQVSEMSELIAKLAVAGDEEARLTFEAANFDAKIRSVSSILSDMPVNISTMGAAFKEVDEVIGETERKIRVLQTQGTIAPELTGPASRMARVLQDYNVSLQESLRKSNAQLKELDASVENINARKKRFFAEASKFNRQDRQSLREIISLAQQNFNISERVALVDKEISKTKLEITAATKDGRFLDRDQLQNRLNLLNIEKSRLANQKETLKFQIPAASDEVRELAQKLLELEGQINSTNQDRLVLMEKLQDARRTLLTLANQELAILRQQLFLDAQRDIAIFGARADAQEEYNAAVARGASSTELDVIQAKARQREIVLATQEIRKQVSAKQEVLTESFALAQTDFERLQSLIAYAEVTKAGTEELRAQKAEFEEIEQFVRRIEDRMSRGIVGGIEQAFEDFGRQFKDAFQTGIEIGKTAIMSFSDFISNAITEAFNPEGKGIKEQFAGFLRSLGAQIMRQLIQMQIAKLAFSLFGGGAMPGTSLVGAGLAFGLHGGGKVPHLSKYAKGYHAAGKIRPAGLHPHDTVPLWGEPGEVMIKRPSVMKYGLNALLKLNQGLIDPLGFKALANTSRAAKRQTTSGPGFQEGGLISDVLREGTAQQKMGQDKLSSPEISRAAVVANEQAMERLLAGGKSAFLRAFDDWGPEIRGRLKIRG